MSASGLNHPNCIARTGSCESLDSVSENASHSSVTDRKVREYIESVEFLSSPIPPISERIEPYGEMNEAELDRLSEEDFSCPDSVIIESCKSNFRACLEDPAVLGGAFAKNLQEILDRDNKEFLCAMLKNMLMAAGCGFAIEAAAFPLDYVQLGAHWETLYMADRNLAVELVLGALIQINMDEARRFLCLAR